MFIFICYNESPALLLSLTPNCRAGYNSQFGGFAWVVRDFLYNNLELNRRQAILYIYIMANHGWSVTNTGVIVMARYIYTGGDCNGYIYIYRAITITPVLVTDHPWVAIIYIYNVWLAPMCIYIYIFSASNLALAGFPLTNALGENLPSPL